jgi:hypothetical protein
MSWRPGSDLDPCTVLKVDPDADGHAHGRLFRRR